MRMSRAAAMTPPIREELEAGVEPPPLPPPLGGPLLPLGTPIEKMGKKIDTWLRYVCILIEQGIARPIATTSNAGAGANVDTCYERQK